MHHFISIPNLRTAIPTAVPPAPATTILHLLYQKPQYYPAKIPTIHTRLRTAIPTVEPYVPATVPWPCHHHHRRLPFLKILTKIRMGIPTLMAGHLAQVTTARQRRTMRRRY